MERLTFNIGGSNGPLVVAGREDQSPQPPRLEPARRRSRLSALRERYDADYLWMVAFTILLFFRPQDHVRALGVLHLAELTAIGGLAAMAVRRLNAGQTVAKINAEVVGVMALGVIILLTIPFSAWPGGSLKVFSDMYVKIILIFTLMISTITTPKRVRQMTWLMVAASGYIAFRAVFDYARGINLTEGDRVRGAVGGFFENPNDLALNLVTFLAPTLFFMMQERKPSRRFFAALLAMVMVAAIVCTKSRSGFLGLAGMAVVVGYYALRSRPALVLAGAFALMVAVPVMPGSFWNRMNSILEPQEDVTGSREARIRVMERGVQVFLENPLTGVGAGQFKNYDSPDITVEKWRATHNVWLQVASELGIFGLFTFAFLVVRAYRACFTTLRWLRGPKRKRHEAQPPTTEADEMLYVNARGMLAALVGWTLCSLFASVAFNWTFYYVLALAVAGRDIVLARRQAAAAEAPAPQRSRLTPQLVRAHA